MNDSSLKHRMAMLLLYLTGILFVISAVILTASGAFSKQEYLEPWEKSYSKQFDDPRIQLICHGLLAANSRNMQPWKIKLDTDKDVFYLFADSERLAKEGDPSARQTMISQGTFLEYVRVAGEESGYRTNITFFPYGEYDEKKLAESMENKPVAKISLTKTESEGNSLYDFMFLADTNRAAYQEVQLSSGEIEELQVINTDPDMKVEIFQDEENRNKLGGYAVEGAKIEAGIHRLNEESANIFRSNEYEKNKYRCGTSLDVQGTSGILKHSMQGLITLVPVINNEKTFSDLYVESIQTAVDNTPAYAMIITKDNSRIQQVKSGMLYSRLVLTAHSLGFVMQPASQTLEEYEEMEGQYKKIHREWAPEGGTIQMLFRMGKATQEFPQSMRRDVMDIIDENE